MTRSPGSVWRTNTTRPAPSPSSSRATQCPPCATGPTSTGPTTSPSSTSAEVAAARLLGLGLAVQPATGEVGGTQQERHRRHHDARGEQQPRLQPQRALVVQDLLPP